MDSDTHRIRDFYTANPRMISSPFGGVDGINRELFIEVLRELGITLADRSVLDVGCGRGFAGEIVREAGGAYTGADLVASGEGFPLVQAEAALLPFPDSAFDILFCIDMFEHLPHPITVTKEFRRVLAPGGCVFLSAPNYANVAGLVKSLCERLGFYEENTWAPFGRWQPQEFEQPLTPTLVRRGFQFGGFKTFHRIGYADEVDLGLFPWIDHPKMPENVRYRLQDFFRAAGPSIVRVWPGASLHNFWKIEA